MPHATVGQPVGQPGGWPSHLVAGSRSDKTPHLPRSTTTKTGPSPVPRLARLCGTSMPPRVPPISLLVAPRSPLPVYPARSRTLAPVFRSLSNNRASRSRRAPPEPPFPTPARILRARISHISIFQNVGSAHAHPPETTHNPTSGSGCETGPFPAFVAIGPAAQRSRHPFRTPQNGPKTVSAPCCKRIASAAQQTPVG
jgi:hypothetical protein